MVKRSTPLLTKLLARVKLLTSKRGSKTALAQVLGVPVQRLHEWLSGSVEPGGETTLQLLEWVTATEASNEKPPTALQARPGENDPTKQNQNEKAKPGTK